MISMFKVAKLIHLQIFDSMFIHNIHNYGTIDMLSYTVLP